MTHFTHPITPYGTVTYWLMAELRKRGADGAFRLYQSRHYDFGTGRCLGRDDHVVEWARPARPHWMDRQTYLATPKTMEVREVLFRVDRPSYRSREVVVATTLLDAKAYSKEDLAG
jgi:putative transposase